MTQSELKEQFIEYAAYNLNNDTTLQAVCELLENISNELYEHGYKTKSNKLTTALLKIKDVMEQ